jgi:hypothetical protein
MSVSQTVTQWADHLVEQAKQKAAKKIGVDKEAEGALSIDGPLFPPRPPRRSSLPALSDIELPPERHAYGEGPRENQEDIVSDFFLTQSDEEADRRREAAKRRQRKTQQRTDPTSTSRFRALEVEAYSLRRFQIDRYVAPPGMEHVVKRLKTKKDVGNPYAVAWAMHERDKHTQDRSIGGLTRIGALEGALHRSLRILDAVSDGHYGVSRDVVERLHSDALEDLDRSFERDDPLREAWRHVVDQARADALGKVDRHSSKQGPPAIDSVEEREPDFPRDAMLEEMSGKGTGLKKASPDVMGYKTGWMTIR